MLLVASLASGCRNPDLSAVDAGRTLRTHYLPDYQLLRDSASGFALSNHLVLFNPGPRATTAKITLFFEEAEPQTLSLDLPAHRSTETNSGSWPVPDRGRFGAMVETESSVIAQATIGWNNSLNDYSGSAKDRAGNPARETALSYLSHRQLSHTFMLADGIVLDSPGLFIRESEWAVLLNPTTDTAHVEIALGFDRPKSVSVAVPPRRVRAVFMDSIAPSNTHYGVIIRSNTPIATNWRREVYWPNRPELMAFWSAPLLSVDTVSTERRP